MDNVIKYRIAKTLLIKYYLFQQLECISVSSVPHRISSDFRMVLPTLPTNRKKVPGGKVLLLYNKGKDHFYIACIMATFFYYPIFTIVEGMTALGQEDAVMPTSSVISVVIGILQFRVWATGDFIKALTFFWKDEKDTLVLISSSHHQH